MQTGETTSTEGNGDSATTEIKNTTLTNNNNMTSVEDSLVAANSMVGVITGILVPASVVLLCVIVVAVCLATVVNKRKATIRSLQREMLTR